MNSFGDQGVDFILNCHPASSISLSDTMKWSHLDRSFRYSQVYHTEVESRNYGYEQLRKWQCNVEKRTRLDEYFVI